MGTKTKAEIGRFVEPLIIRHPSGYSTKSKWTSSSISKQADMLAWHVTNVRGIAGLLIRDSYDVVGTVSEEAKCPEGVSEGQSTTTTLVLSRNSRNSTPSKRKKHLGTYKSGSKYYPKASPDSLRKQEIVGTPAVAEKK